MARRRSSRFRRRGFQRLTIKAPSHVAPLSSGRLQVTKPMMAVKCAMAQAVLRSLTLLLTQEHKMPFDEQGFYYHDFENLPTIPEEDEEEALSAGTEKEVQRSAVSKDLPFSGVSDEHEYHSPGAMQTTSKLANDARNSTHSDEPWNRPGHRSRLKPPFCLQSDRRATLKQPAKPSSPLSAQDGTDHEPRRRVWWRRLPCKRLRYHSSTDKHHL